MIVFAFILLYSISRYFDLSDFGLHNGCEWYSYITFNFIHLTFFHLITNSVMMIIYGNLIKQVYNKFVSVIIPAISAVLSGVLFVQNKPTFGASAILFSLLGMYMCYLYRKKIQGYIRFFIITAILIAIQSLVAHDMVNWRIHIFSMVFSFITAYAYESVRTIRYNRSNRGK